MGIAGLLLLIKIIDRLAFYKDFSISKINSRLKLRYRPKMGLEQIEFSTEAKLRILQTRSGSTLVIEDNQKNLNVLAFGDLGYTQKESLNAMIDKSNN